MTAPKVAAAVSLAAMALFMVLFGILLVGGAGAGVGSRSACDPRIAGGSGVTVDPSKVPDTLIAGYGHEQLVNAAHIIQAGKDLELGAHDQAIGVMTAMGESSLKVIDYGDAAGPDSRGLFQQRANGAWGSYEDRMNPRISATNFFKAMMKVSGREALTPTMVAHLTQGNADPNHYTKYWSSAVEVMQRLSGVADIGATCQDLSTSSDPASANGWTIPGTGPISSGFGQRLHPIDRVWRLHSGVDLHAGGCGGPIWAAHDGNVIRQGFDSLGNGVIIIDHGGGLTTSYLHMYAEGMLVSVGDQVQAGQQIAKTGSSGQSTGCHLHFTVKVDGSPVDPEQFMSSLGVTLG